MAKQKGYTSVESAAYDMYRIVSDYMSKDGVAWLVGKLRTNIVRTVYRRAPSMAYDRTDAFKKSVRGRVVDKGKHGMSYAMEMFAFADPTDMSPKHTSWATGTPYYNNWDVNEKLADWLDSGHGGMGVHYRPARFFKKTEEEIDNPAGLIRSLRARLRAEGFQVYGKSSGREGEI